jgi:4-amino-4-deoxy-L-arabinose transferase-like glycosyltransferase
MKWLRSNRTAWFLAIALAAYAWVVSEVAWWHKCPTWDEPSHVTAGYAYLRMGDFRLYAVNPPLAKEIAAIPLLFLKLNPPDPKSPFWVEGKDALLARQFLYEQGNDADRIFRWVRIWMGFFGAVALIVLFAWVRRYVSSAVALLSVALLALNPSFLALLPLATTDTMFVLATLLLAWSLTAHLSNPCLRRAGTAGLAWGLCLAIKHTALIFAPIVLGILFLASRHLAARQYGAAVRESLQSAALATVVAFTLVWATYGFGTSPAVQSADDSAKLAALVDKFLPLGSAKLRAETAQRIGRVEVPARPYLVSALDMLGLRPALTASDSGYTRTKYLCGKRHRDGFRQFTLFAMVAKNPIPFLAAALVGVFWLRTLPQPTRLVSLSLLLVLFGVGTLKRDFAFRYFNFPMLPFLAIVGANGLYELARRRSRVLKAVIPAVLLWGGLETWLAFPHLLAYFSPLVGGPEKGVACLLDSNSDWGQDLPLLAKWQRQTGIGPLKLAYNGTVPPDHYGLRCILLPGVDASTFDERPDPEKLQKLIERTGPDTGTYAISTTCLYNIQGFYPGADYSWLLKYEPIAILGHTIRIYRVAEVPPRVGCNGEGRSGIP